MFQWVHFSLLRLDLRDSGKCVSDEQTVFLFLSHFWPQRDKKRDDDFVFLFDITTESLLAVRIVLLTAKIISAIAWLITLIKNKTCLTHNFLKLLLWGTQWVNAITQPKHLVRLYDLANNPHATTSVSIWSTSLVVTHTTQRTLRCHSLTPAKFCWSGLPLTNDCLWPHLHQ